MSLVRANAAGLKYRFKVITPVCILFIDRRSRADEQRHHAIPSHPRPGTARASYDNLCCKLVSFHGLVEGGWKIIKRRVLAERGTRRTKRDWAAASPFFAAAAALVLASISLHKVVTLERVQREGSKKKEYDSVADEWVHQRVTESESDDDSVEALTVRTPLQ